jgi:hypothetical protein
MHSHVLRSNLPAVLHVQTRSLLYRRSHNQKAHSERRVVVLHSTCCSVKDLFSFGCCFLECSPVPR